jgi:hypothetical protein
MKEVRRGAPAVELDDSPEPRGILSTPRRRKRKVRGSLIVQFAANDGQQLADAAELVKPWVDGIDLNCGGLSPMPHVVLSLTSLALAEQDVLRSGPTRRESAALCYASLS